MVFYTYDTQIYYMPLVKVKTTWWNQCLNNGITDIWYYIVVTILILINLHDIDGDLSENLNKSDIVHQMFTFRF